MLSTFRSRIGTRSLSTAVKMASKMKMIDLQRGHPTTSLLATNEMQEAAQRVLSRASNFSPDSFAEDRHPLHYGPDLGNETLRRDIGLWTSRRYGLTGKDIPGPERINLTAGASNGLASILNLVTSPVTGYTRRAFIISPVYFLACAIFQDAGFSNLMTSISMTEGGTSIDFDALIRELKKDKDLPPQPLPDHKAGISPIKSVAPKEIYRYVLYCVTTHSNPTGTTMSQEARKRLVEIAREWDILLISDDVYDFLSYETGEEDQSAAEVAAKRLVTIDREMGIGEDDKGHTISNCSFSKLLGPGLRVGWVESPSSFLAKAIGESGANHSGGAPCQFTSTLVHDLIVSNLTQPAAIDTVIKKISTIYGERSRRLIKAIETQFPKGTTIQGGQGGYFIWVELPHGYNAREIGKIGIESEGVKVGNGDLFDCPDGEGSGIGTGNKMGWGDRCMRLSISYQKADVLEEAVSRFARAIKIWEEKQKH